MAKDFPLVDWIQGSNVYEINTRQFTELGDFKGLINHIDSLADMGVGVLWFMPIMPIGLLERKGSLGSYYAISNYMAINPEFGNEADFLQIVDKAHQRGMKIIIDWVANHTAVDHYWAKEHPEFYKKDATGNFVELHGWDDVIDLNYDNEALCQEMISNMKYWIETFDIDGFRCDMAHLVPLEFWQKARTELDQSKPLFWLAECDDDAYLSVFDSNYSWRWMHISEAICKNNEHLVEGKKILQDYLDNTKNNLKLYFTSNHDENTWNGTEYEKYGEFAGLLASFSNLFYGLALTYSGQELPNEKRLAFFERDPIEWQEGQKPTLFDQYQKLFQFRKENAHYYSKEAKCELLDIATHGIGFQITVNQSTMFAIFNFSKDTSLLFYSRATGISQLKNIRSFHSGISYPSFSEEEIMEIPPNNFILYYQ